MHVETIIAFILCGLAAIALFSAFAVLIIAGVKRGPIESAATKQTSNNG